MYRILINLLLWHAIVFKHIFDRTVKSYNGTECYFTHKPPRCHLDIFEMKVNARDRNTCACGIANAHHTNGPKLGKQM